MELRVLRYFMTIAREGSITSAANVLHVTQPTLSRQIRDLENELGQKLFIRGSHHMTLTAEGMVLRKRAEEILSMVDKTEAEFHAMESTVSGDIYIGSGETQAIQHIAEIAKEIREDHPGIHYHLYSGNAEDVTERLDKGLLDFGILIVRRDSPFAEKTSIRKEDLLHVPLICSRQAISKSRQNNEFTAWFGEDFEKLDIVTTFNLVYNAAIMVASGLGCAVTIDKIANTTESSNLCFRPLEPRLHSGLNIIWKKHQIFSSAAEVFLEKLRENFGSPSL